MFCVLLVVLWSEFNPATVVAGFVPSETANSVVRFTVPEEGFQSAGYALTLTTGGCVIVRPVAESSDGAGRIETEERQIPFNPVVPFGRLAADMVAVGFLASASSDQNSAGAAPTSGGGGSSGAVGIFDFARNLTAPHLIGRLQTQDSVKALPGIPSDVFRPPPITTRSA
jgi:hypothetical protein